MGTIVGARVARNNFHLEEDCLKPLSPGVSWRRRRFRFRLADEPEEELSRVGLCINEVNLDMNCEGTLRPSLAADFPELADFSEIENAYWQTNWATGAIRGGRGTKESRLYLNTAALLARRPEDPKGMFADLQKLNALTEYSEQAAASAPWLEPAYYESENAEFKPARYWPAFPPSRLVQSSENVLAACNSGYFLNFPEEYEADGVSSLHQPVGGHMAHGRFFMPPWLKRAGLLGLSDGQLRGGLFGPDDLIITAAGRELPLHRMTEHSAAEGAVIRHFDPPLDKIPPGCRGIVFCGVTAIDETAAGGDMPRIPFGGALVLVPEEWRPALGEWEVRLANHPSAEWMICAGPFLVRGGKAVPPEAMFHPDNAGEFFPNGPAPTRFPYDADQTKAPRTAIGLTPSGGLKLVVVDGRRSREHSLGADLAGMGRLMEAVGCDSAINLDGGGSSVLCIEGAESSDMLQEHLAHGVVNIPSDEGGRERVVPVILAVERKNR